MNASIIGQSASNPEPAKPADAPDAMPPPAPEAVSVLAAEYGGREGPEPTRYGDWEKNGRCIDF